MFYDLNIPKSTMVKKTEVNLTYYRTLFPFSFQGQRKEALSWTDTEINYF